MTDKSYRNWKMEVDQDHILWLTIDKYGTGVNSLNREVIGELDEIIDQISADPSLIGVVLRSGKTSGFVAGADIEQFVTLANEEEAFELVRQAQLVFDKLAALKVPVVAMIEGFCLGGGLELALACRHRVVEDSAKTQLGAPEVKLGLHPGFGGTVRLPQIIGVLPAMEMNLSGRPVSPQQAAKNGLADVIVPKRDLERAAHYYASQRVTPHKPSAFQQLLESPLLRPLVAKNLYKKLAAKVNKDHYPAPFAIIDNWQRDGANGKNAMVNEAKSIAHLLVSDTSRNLVRVFFLQTRLKGLGKGVKFPAQHVHVIGAGTMGGDIAAWCALRGLHVTLQDQSPALIAPAIKRAYELFTKKLKLPRLVQAAVDRLLADCDGVGVSRADVVIEAISENLQVKQALYQMIEPQLKAGAILATNTSSLPLSQLNQVLKNPERLVGIHFFNPVAMMQLVEVVQGAQTDPESVNKALAFVRILDRLPLPVKSEPGFLVNRVLMPYLLEAMLLLEEGCPAATIDQAATTFGMPMGPVELADTVGLDVCLAVAEVLSAHYGGSVPQRLKDMVAQGTLGRKTSRGFYLYEKGKPIKTFVAYSEQSLNSDQDVANRLILRMLNEAVACWREKIVEDADLLDAGMIFGTGFAPFRGGPLHYAKVMGIERIIEKLEELEQQYGGRFRPDEGWEQLLVKEREIVAL